MSGDWLPVLLVLAAGVAAGLLVVWRLARRGTKTAVSQDEDAALRRTDLELRRDELLERLRCSDNEADRRVLEEQAARVLRDLDRLGGEGAAPKQPAAEREKTAAPAPAPTRGRPMLIGFLGGAAMVGLVSLLVFFALRDAEPDASRDMAQPAGTAAEGEEHPGPPLPADVEARLTTLRQRAAADPTDLVARKQLALALLSAQQFFEAFEISQAILEESPDDPDGLYVQGMVRMTMGQDDVALGLLDRVLEQYPNHVLALAGRGMVFMRRGDREAAVLVWERALEAAGGSHPDLEELLAMARGGAETRPESEQAVAEGFDEVPPAGRAPAAGASSPAAGSPVASSPARETPAADSFGVRIELTPGAEPRPGATLFVFLREGEQGPPAAVRRVHDPVFPVRLALGPNDSMLGRPLPSAGTITARLDADGNAGTESAGDLVAVEQARLGATVVLRLGGR